MKLRYLASVVALAMTTVAAHAQTQGKVGLYLNPIAIRVSNSVADTGPFAFLGEGDTSRAFWGFDLGGYYNFYDVAPLTVGVDVRTSDLHANNASIHAFQVGLRLTGQPFALPIKPYIEASAGVGSTKAPTSAVNVRKGDFNIYGGIDYTLQKHVDLRVIELGYGSLTTVSSTTVGPGTTVAIPASKLVTFSSGLVFRF